MSFEIHASGTAQARIEQTVPSLVTSLIASAITAQDADVWGLEAAPEAASRLGWVNSVSISRPLVSQIEQLRAHLRDRGIRRVVVAGMGGSSLGAQIIAATAGAPLVVLDSTAPADVLAAMEGSSESGTLAETVLVVSSKTGLTVETDAARRAFEAAWRDLGANPADHIVVVTDPNSPLDTLAQEAGYRTFHADPNVGGRYSALTAYGLVPAGLAGADLNELLDEAEATLLEVAIDDPRNPALALAAAIAGGTGEHAHKDTLGIVADGTHIPGLDDWIEQLLAESTGKGGTGILPVVLLPVSPELDAVPGDMQILRLVEDAVHLRLREEHPGEILLSGSLGGALVVWMYAVAIAGKLLGINPFDQPDVEAAKAATRALLDAPPAAEPPALIEGQIEVRVSDPALALPGTLSGVLRSLWDRVGPRGYVAIQAYASTTSLAPLAGLRELVAAASGRPTTFGWGPRFLHSTGQFHKGGPAEGVFLQILGGSDVDLEIPGLPFTFGQLIAAQAAGDAAVLAAQGRPVVRVTLNDPQSDVLALFDAAQ